MDKQCVFLFPGQGSQVRGMGESLFDEFPKYVELANKILGYDIKTLCLSDPNNQLHQTQYTQPALYVVNALTYYKKMQENPTIDYVAGHSLGEYNALHCANVFDFETGLKLVKKRGELMAQSSGGGMAAIIGLTYNHVETIIQEYQLSSLSIANYNSYRQFVISGLQEDIQRAKNIFEDINTAMFIQLNVSGAFHSFHMLAAEKLYVDFLESIHFNTPTLPVIANCNATIYHPAVIRKYLTKQLSQSVQWSKTIEYFLSQGESHFEEIGPGKVLSGLVRKISNRE